MKPKAFLQAMKAGERPAAGYLFAGPETFFRDRCRRALVRAIFGDEGSSEEGLVEIDLRDQPLARALDEARALSLFASKRLIRVANAEQAVPAGRPLKDNESMAELAAYFRDPTPGVVLAFEATRYDPRDRDDKAKLERVLEFYRAAPAVVEMDRLSADDAVKGCALLARNLGLDIGGDVLVELVEMLGADMARLENEIVKLKLYVGDRAVARADIELMTPEARQSGAFELTDALADRDRDRALRLVDTLHEAGTYWPMQLGLLASLFRQTLAVKEAGARDARQAMAELGRAGVRTWYARAQQLVDASRRFTREQLVEGLIALHEADRDLRRPRPDDRLLVETLLLRLTAR